MVTHTPNCHGGTCDDRVRDVIHAIPDGSCCDHYGARQPAFICEQCKRTVGYCMGGPWDALCDHCWAVNWECEHGLECTDQPGQVVIRIDL